MKPQSAKRQLTSKFLRPVNKYRQAKTLQEYWDQRVILKSKFSGYNCWQFSTKGDKDGYPQVHGSRLCKEAGVTRGHQLSYLLFKGPIPKDGVVCHSCDNPWCVNPDHLFLGTPNDNIQDMMQKGRYRHPTEITIIGKLSFD